MKTTAFETVREVAIQKGGACLSTSYLNAAEPMAWRCGRKHEWTSSFATAKKYWCPTCSEEARLKNQFEKIRSVAIERGGECLSEEYMGADVNHVWRCKVGHVFDMQPVRLAGRWCGACNKEEKQAQELKVLQDLAVGKGGKCLSESYVNNSTKMSWECGHLDRHHWMAVSASIKTGTWCPYCVRPSAIGPVKSGASVNVEKTNQALIHSERGHVSCVPNNAKRSGLVRIESPFWPNEKQRLSQLHIGSDLRAYFDEALPTVTKALQVVGGSTPTLQYPGSLMHMDWKCRKGHEWKMTLRQFQNGSWCNQCQRDSDQAKAEELQKKFNLVVEGSVDDANEIKKWRCSRGHVTSLSLSYLAQRNKYGCEPCYKEEKRVSVTSWASEHGFDLLDPIPSKATVAMRWACRKCNEVQSLSESEMRKRKVYCRTCYGVDVIEQARAAAIAKGGACLTTSYGGSKDFFRFKCSDPAHPEWRTEAYMVINGSWCKECSKSPTRTLADAHKLAKEKGGKCLSATYKHNQAPMQWKCASDKCEGFTSSFNSVSMGQWCPTCRNKGEFLTRELFKEFFDHDFPSAHPAWLRRKELGKPMQLDGYCEKLSLAFEYQGVQHASRSAWLHRTEEDFKQQQMRDQQKKIKCRENGVVLVEVPQFARTRDKEARPAVVRALLAAELPTELRSKIEKLAIQWKVRNTGKLWLTDGDLDNDSEHH